jgi:hypothetical protein
LKARRFAQEATMSIFTAKPKITATCIAVAMAAAPATALANAGAATPVTNWEIHLNGSTAHRTANGSAQYQSQPGQREIQIEVQHIRSMAGRTVVFSAAGVRLGSAKVSTRGQADITHNTELGQKVPSIVHGSNVTVRTSGGRLIVSGRF